MSVDTTIIADDNYIVRLRVEDFAGNITNASSAQVKIDNTAPAAFTPITPANNSATNVARPSFTWTTSSDTNGVNYDIYVDSGLVASNLNTNSYTLGTDLTEGAHTWTIIAKDPAGNNTSTSTYTFIEDRTPPNNYTVNVNVNSTSPSIAFGATDSLSGIQGYQVAVNGGSFVAMTSPYLPGPLADGSYSVTVRAFDKAGNFRDVTNNFTIDGRHSMLLSKGDFNFDGKVDLSDLSILAARWNTSNTTADANNDGTTNLSDLSILAANWQKTF